MKFAQEFKRSLQREGFPQKWIDTAIPYGQLKKCIKKVAQELDDLGLDRDTLAKLAIAHDGTIPADASFHYDMDVETVDATHFRPRLTVFVHLKDGLAVDAKLSPATRSFIEKLVASQPHNPLELNQTSSSTALPEGPNDGSLVDDESCTHDDSDMQRVEVPLVFDGQFFDILQTDVSKLDALQEEEQQAASKGIQELGSEIARITRPGGGKKAQRDLAQWRDIFELYLDARIFFSARESDHGARTSVQALQQLQWFQNEVLKRKLVQGFKTRESRQSFSRFLSMNAAILQNLKFQEINRLAVTKILKKFDKRTSLGATKTFSGAMHSGRLLAGSMAKDLCAQVSTELVACVPQLDDYLCPICFAIAYWPIRLDCQHVFCSRCLVKLQRKGEGHCPLCRGDVIMQASMAHFDEARAEFMRQYFPKEVKEKMRASEMERGKEVFGPDYGEDPCVIM